MIHVILHIMGYALILLGLAGLAAPILPGWIFIFVGLFILARYARWARRVLDWFRERHPKVRQIIDRAEGVSTRYIRIVTVRVGRLFKAARAR